MFLKEKSNGTILARGCAGGRLQRIYTSKEDTSSPTVSIEAMMLLCAKYAKDSRSFPTCRHGKQRTHATRRNSHKNDRKNWTQQYTENTYGTTNTASPCYMYNFQKLYLGHYKQHYYFGNYYQKHYRSGDSY